MCCSIIWGKNVKYEVYLGNEIIQTVHEYKHVGVKIRARSSALLQEVKECINMGK